MTCQHLRISIEIKGEYCQAVCLDCGLKDKAKGVEE